MNPAHDYRKIAKTIVEKFKDNLLKTIETGQAPDLYWKLEQAIADALKYVDMRTDKRVRAEVEQIIKEFDRDNGTTSS